MIENLSSEIDTFSGRVFGIMVSETNETNLENIAATSRPTELNEMTQAGSHYTRHPKWLGGFQNCLCILKLTLISNWMWNFNRNGFQNF